MSTFWASLSIEEIVAQQGVKPFDAETFGKDGLSDSEVDDLLRAIYEPDDPRYPKGETMNFAAPNPICNSTWSQASIFMEMCTAQGITGVKLMINPEGVAGQVDNMVPLTLDFYTTNNLSINTPIDICAQIPNSSGLNDVGMVLFATGCGVSLKKALT